MRAADDESRLLGCLAQRVDIGFQQFGVSRVAAALECETRLEQGSRGHEFVVVRPGQEALKGVRGFEVVAAFEVERAEQNRGFRAGLRVEVFLRHLRDARDVVVRLDRVVQHPGRRRAVGLLVELQALPSGTPR